ncbi:hypothetical protein NG54_03515 [Heyndrickxia ginsengihumi]|uniref:Uncharacterized protein n=1 Tax=Heyndrickxia ginsengihumi TaxID=363870 RepID=A0A0A6VG39_9BACI|nr:hypothetical protein [Heyndrickxia ginsengihumi]KHD86388.1 hypothetical protein NG54_03515 [Heyndrickxia ginsengihumi]
MYRPTVRYSDTYKQFVDKLFLSTRLDRNQIIRAALFTAPFSEEFIKIMMDNKKDDVPLSTPMWRLQQAELWMEQSPNIEEGKDVNAYDGRTEKNEITSGVIGESRRQQQKEERRQLDPQRRVRTIPITSRTANGGITIRL